MSWFRVDDSIPDHPKVDALLERRDGLAALGLWSLAGAWSSKQLTDGFVPSTRVKRLGGKSSHARRLVEVGLWDEVDAWWGKVAAKVFESYWKPTYNYHLRKAFLMKYSEDTQKTLGLHNDASMVTGSVKLNDDYEGATLIFPRQGVTNRDIPVGKMILFPGQVTHGHHVDRLESGTKYSATFWSARYRGDLLDPE